MTTFFAILILLAVMNLSIFAVNKLFALAEPFLFKLFFKKPSNALDDPEFKEKRKVRNKYLHLFWSTIVVFWYLITPLQGIHFLLAFFNGIALYMIGTTEMRAITKIYNKYREKEMLDEMLETHSSINKFFEELKLQIDTVQAPGPVKDKKDDERN